MKRTAILSRGAPMKRSGPIKAKAMAEKRQAPAPKRKAMKPTRPRMTPIRKSARGEDCTMLIPGVCNRDPATTVLCHSNQLADGKGLGLKAPDTEACYGCSACHDVLDGRRPRPAWMTGEQLLDVFRRARAITQEKLKEKGLL